MFLKNNQQIALYVACGDLTDIKIENNELKVFVDDKTMFEVLTDGKREIERGLSWQGLDISVCIVLKESKNFKQEEDIKKLREVFGEKLVIKGEV